MHSRLSKLSSLHHERGAVLFVALVFLILITLLGLTATSSSILQERMTGGLHNGQLALMGAETALRGEEWTIWNKSNNATSNKLHCGRSGGSDFCYSASNANPTGVTLMSSLVTAFRSDHAWLGTTDGGNTATASLTGLTNSQATASLALQPRYILEELGKVLPPGAPANCEGGARYGCGGRRPGDQTLYAYRVSARATGGNQGSMRIAESYFVALPPSF